MVIKLFSKAEFGVHIPLYSVPISLHLHLHLQQHAVGSLALLDQPSLNSNISKKPFCTAFSYPSPTPALSFHSVGEHPR